MPIIFNYQIDSSTSLCVWHITETEESLFLNKDLSEKETLFIKNQKLLKRRLEMLACRLALHHLIKQQFADRDYPCEDIKYDENGAPFIASGNISFSHSQKYAAVILSTSQQVGLDIEVIGARMADLYPRFMNKVEIDRADTSNVQELHYYWSGKEAVLKLFKNKSIDFQSNIYIPPLDKVQTEDALYQQEEHVQLFHFEIENCCMVAAIKK